MAEFNFDAAVANQENGNKVQNSAIAQAKENIAKRKAEQEAAEAERCLNSAERLTNDAVKDATFASKKKNILKKYTEDIQAAKASFEATGDTQEWRKKSEELTDKKDDELDKAKRAVYGDDYRWR